MGKKKTNKTKIKETAKAEFKVIEKPKEEPATITEESIPTEQDKKEESVPEEVATTETPAEVKEDEYAENELCNVPCRCLVCSAEWEWGVPLNIGTPMLYFRDCKKCR